MAFLAGIARANVRSPGMLMHPANRDRIDGLIAAVESRMDEQLDELATAICEGRDATRPMLLLNKLESIIGQLKGVGWRPLQ
jgi:hypothetical protein